MSGMSITQSTQDGVLPLMTACSVVSDMISADAVVLDSAVPG
jgi:hypothetical protein